MIDAIGGYLKKQISMLLFTLIFVFLLYDNSSAQRYSLNTSTGLSKVVILDSRNWNTGILASLNGYFRFNSKIKAGLSLSYSRIPKNMYITLNYSPWDDFGDNTLPITGYMSVIEIIPMFKLNLTGYNNFESSFIFQSGIGLVRIKETKSFEYHIVRSSKITKEYYPGFNLGLGFILYKDSRFSYEYLFQFKTIFTKPNFIQMATLGMGITFNK